MLYNDVDAQCSHRSAIKVGLHVNNYSMLILNVYFEGAAAGNCHLYYANGTQVSSGWEYGIYVDTPIRHDTSNGSLVATFLSENITGKYVSVQLNI